jgi:hypothetical protein
VLCGPDTPKPRRGQDGGPTTAERAPAPALPLAHWGRDSDAGQGWEQGDAGLCFKIARLDWGLGARRHPDHRRACDAAKLHCLMSRTWIARLSLCMTSEGIFDASAKGASHIHSHALDSCNCSENSWIDELPCPRLPLLHNIVLPRSHPKGVIPNRHGWECGRRASPSLAPLPACHSGCDPARQTVPPRPPKARCDRAFGHGSMRAIPLLGSSTR